MTKAGNLYQNGKHKEAGAAVKEVQARLEKLAALGSVGAAGGARNMEDRPRGDPKDKIGLYNLIKQASGASAESRVRSGQIGDAVPPR